MLDVVRGKEKVRWYETPAVLDDLSRERTRRRNYLSEVKESVRGIKEEFDVRKYYRLRYHREPGEISDLLAESVERDYYLTHPEFTTIQELVDYDDQHEYDT